VIISSPIKNPAKKEGVKSASLKRKSTKTERTRRARLLPSPELQSLQGNGKEGKKVK